MKIFIAFQSQISSQPRPTYKIHIHKIALRVILGQVQLNHVQYHRLDHCMNNVLTLTTNSRTVCSYSSTNHYGSIPVFSPSSIRLSVFGNNSSSPHKVGELCTCLANRDAVGHEGALQLETVLLLQTACST